MSGYYEWRAQFLTPAKKCPFCGVSDHFFKDGAVACDACQAEGPAAGQFTGDMDEDERQTLKKAVRLWNGRSR